MTPLSNEIRGALSPSGFKEAAVFGILTYIKLGLIAVCLIVCGYLVWNYKHMQFKIVTLQAEVASQKIKVNILDQKAKTVDAFMARKQKIQTRVVQEEQVVDEAVTGGDPANVIKLFDPYRSHVPTEPKKRGAL
jgi:hypothetical protein